MATQGQILTILNILGETLTCPVDGTRLRYGDIECPHCGADLDGYLRQFAERLANSVTSQTA